MFFPIADDDRALYRPCYVTWGLLIANVVVFCIQLASPEFTYGFAATPAEITSGKDIVGLVRVAFEGETETIEIPHGPGPWPIYLTLLASMFMHGGWMHLGGNLLFLYIFGDNVEHRFGSLRFLLFYLASGLVASLAQVLVDAESVVPTLGASGAISGVMGAYLVLFPHNRVYAVVAFVFIVSVPAYLVLVMWAVLQFFSGIGSLSETTQAGGVAYAAHIGGFLAGGLMALLVRRRLKAEPESGMRASYRRDPRDRRWW